MAKITLAPLGATAFNGSFVNQLNTNLSKLASAVNDGVLWKADPATGQNTMSVDLNMDGRSILNAVVDGASLTEVKRKAYASSDYATEASQWAVAANQYAEDASDFADEAGASAHTSGLYAQVATNKAQELSGAVSAVAANTQAISALNTTVASNRVTADSGIAANTSAISALSTTVTNNKTAADATATALTALTTRVTAEEAKVQSVAKGGTGATTTAAARTNLGLGSSSTVNTGTSGDVIPLLSANNTWSGIQTHTGNLAAQSGTTGTYTVYSSSGYISQYRISSNGTEGAFDLYSNVGSTNNNVMRISANGNLYNSNNSYGSLSDASLKENIEDAESQLDDVMSYRVVNYNLIADSEKRRHLGLIAQEVEEVSPGLISEYIAADGTPLKAVQYSIINIKVLKAVQELYSRIQALEAQAKA